jgi:hypothetical protein
LGDLRAARKPLYFRRQVAQFGGRMTRHSLGVLILALAAWFATLVPLRADAAATALAKSAVLDGNVAYLQVGQVETNLADEIRSAQSALAVSNKIAGTVLDLRFAGGDDAAEAQAAKDVLTEEKLPLAILVNLETRGTAVTLASSLRAARAGLVFESVPGSAGAYSVSNAPAHSDIAVAIGTDDERTLMENPYSVPALNNTNSPVATNRVLPPVDYTSEADLVRARIKDGEEVESVPPPRKTAPPTPFIRDPVLARAVDLIKGLAIVRAPHP